MDYTPIRAFLVGRCSKTLKDAALTSLEEYELLLDGRTREDQEEWERMRWMVFMEWSISPTLKRRPKTPQDIVLFPWEEKTKFTAVNVEPLQEEEISKLCEIFKIKREQMTNGQD